MAAIGWHDWPVTHQPESTPGKLELLLESSWTMAGSGLRSAWPPEHRLGAQALLEFAAGSRFCVLAYLAGAERLHAIPVSFLMGPDGDFWIPSGGDSVRTRFLRAHPWAAIVVGPESAPGHRLIRAEGPTSIVAAADLHQSMVPEVRQKLGQLSWCVSWLLLQPSSLLGWGVPSPPNHSVGRSSRSPG